MTLDDEADAFRTAVIADVLKAHDQICRFLEENCPVFVAAAMRWEIHPATVRRPRAKKSVWSSSNVELDTKSWAITTPIPVIIAPDGTWTWGHLVPWAEEVRNPGWHSVEVSSDEFRAEVAAVPHSKVLSPARMSLPADWLWQRVLHARETDVYHVDDLRLVRSPAKSRVVYDEAAWRAPFIAALLGRPM